MQGGIKLFILKTFMKVKRDKKGKAVAYECKRCHVPTVGLQPMLDHLKAFHTPENQHVIPS